MRREPPTATRLGPWMPRPSWGGSPTGIRWGTARWNLVEYAWDSPTNRVDFIWVLTAVASPPCPPILRSGGTRRGAAGCLRDDSRVSLQLLVPREDCSKEQCLKEAHQIADAYVRVFYEERRQNPPWVIFKAIFGLPNHYRWGLYCYQWQIILWNELEPYSRVHDETFKCFDIVRVGLLGRDLGTLKLQHNWIAISTAYSTTNQSGRAPAGGCTVYLDPWMGNGPQAYFSRIQYHPLHNCVHSYYAYPDDCRETSPCYCQGVETCPLPNRGYGCDQLYFGY